MAPGDGLVIGRVVLEAAVEDPDEAIAEGSESGVMGVSGRPVAVVEGSSSW